MLDNLSIGFQNCFSLSAMMIIVAGVIIGILIGAMPGMNASTGVALLLPFTFTMEPAMGLVLLCALYTAAEYGGSITAITINTPGTSAAIATTFDGYQLAKQGKAGIALGTSLVSSMIGGMISTVACILIGEKLAQVGLKFGPAEYFSLGVFGLTIISSLSSGSYIKGFIAAGLGLLIACIGSDPFTSYPRFTFGRMELLEGIELIPILLGLFAVSEIFKIMDEQASEKKTPHYGKESLKLPNLKDYWKIKASILRGSVVGTLIGILPGAGAAIASLVSYDQEKKLSKHPEMFGKGAVEGVAGPEAANNGAVGGSLIPLLTLGIPGSATTAILIGGLMMHNITPGPQLFAKNPELVYTLFASLFLANMTMLILGLAGTQIWGKITLIPKNLLVPCVLFISAIGSYAVGQSMFDVIVMIIFGVIGYIFYKFGIPVAPVVLAVVLGKIIEQGGRRALLQSGGDYLVFLKHPISVVLLVAAVFFTIYPIVRDIKRKKRTSIQQDIASEHEPETES